MNHSQTKAFAVGVAGAFVGVLALIVFLFFWQYPLLFNFGLERAAWEEMRVLVVSALVGAMVGFGGAFIPKPKPKTALAVTVLLAVGFGVMWLAPLLLPMGSPIRLAWEEMRVVVVGALVGGLIGYVLGWATRKRRK